MEANQESRKEEERRKKVLIVLFKVALLALGCSLYQCRCAMGVVSVPIIFSFIAANDFNEAFVPVDTLGVGGERIKSELKVQRFIKLTKL